jgi:RimJ/RimL family protein N-acetyltransferase
MNDDQPANDTVTFRPWSEQDLPLLQRLLGDPAMTEYLGGPETPEQIQARHKRYHKDSRMLVIVLNGRSAGSVGYWEKTWREQEVWEMGWSVLPEFQGQGLATKGVVAVLEYARGEGAHRFAHAFPSVDNTPSNALCRKLGFMLLGETKFEYPPGHFMRVNDWQFNLFS